MDAGILDRRVILERNVPVQDSSGDPVPDWQELATVWAKITPGAGREGDVTGGIIADFDTRLRMRYLPVTRDLTPVDRIRYGSRIFNIVRVMDVDDAHVEIRVDANSGLNDG